jgi:hypothetical protein
MGGLVENLQAQRNPLGQAGTMQNQLDTAQLGKPIADSVGRALSIGGSAAGFGGSIGAGDSRAGSGAVAEYNKSLSTTDATISYDAARFSAKHANTRVRIYGRQDNKIVSTLSMPLKEATLQRLYKDRMATAVSAGRKYIK